MRQTRPVDSYLFITLGAGLGVVSAAMVITAFAAKALNRVAVVDITWPLGFVAIAWVSALIGQASGEGDDIRRWILVALVTLWGGRLAWHIRRRAIGHGEDPRYESMLGGTLDQVGLPEAIKRVFIIQGSAMWFISIPVMVGAISDVDWWPVVIVGIVVWLIGVVFEAVGDAQLAAYKEIPKEERPVVMDRGLWRYTRHPNYFGDASVWWGLWLVGALASGWLPGLLTILSPLVMTFFLVFGTGAKLLEKTMMKREGYPEYAERTSFFFPLPPKKK